MDLAKFLQIVETTTAGQWLKLDVQTVYRWDFGERTGENYIEPISFETLAVYKEDIDISLLMAATVGKDFIEPWSKKFPDSQASPVAIILRYRGATVYKSDGVLADGGRYLLPMPSRSGTSFQVRKSALPLARLLFELYAPGGVESSLDDTLKRAGISTV